MAQAPDRRIIVYPNYIDSTKTVAEGRCIPKDLACANPHIIEMLECCTKILKLPTEAENKQYPRAWWVPGRLRVQLKNADGTPVNPEIPNKRTLMIQLADAIAKIPNRGKNKPAGPAEAAPLGMAPGMMGMLPGVMNMMMPGMMGMMGAADAAGVSAAGPSKAASSSGGSNKKKNKGKK